MMLLGPSPAVNEREVVVELEFRVAVAVKRRDVGRGSGRVVVGWLVGCDESPPRSRQDTPAK